MTKIVVGVDNLCAYRPVVGLVERLGFPEPQLSLLHAARETLPYAPAFGPSREVEAQYAETTTALGNAALGEAMKLVSSKGLPCEARMTHGNAANALIEAAKAENADVIAINTNPAGVARNSYIGSVPRALTIGSPTSVLFAKGEKGKRGVFRAVFATDHSPFAERCLARFLELAPKGIEEIHVLSAWQVDDRESELLGRNIAMLGGDVDRWIEESVEEKNAEVVKRFEAAGYRSGSIVVKEKPNEAIHHAMERVRADLLIVGSQGSGAMTRDLIGSVSLHQVTSEFYPVLVVRPREEG
jgi:nucleotide-binding universal stress UspA family protein